jgi:hypothetical protein
MLNSVCVCVCVVVFCFGCRVLDRGAFSGSGECGVGIELRARRSLFTVDVPCEGVRN